MPLPHSFTPSASSHASLNSTSDSKRTVCFLPANYTTRTKQYINAPVNTGQVAHLKITDDTNLCLKALQRVWTLRGLRGNTSATQGDYWSSLLCDLLFHFIAGWLKDYLGVTSQADCDFCVIQSRKDKGKHNRTVGGTVDRVSDSVKPIIGSNPLGHNCWIVFNNK